MAPMSAHVYDHPTAQPSISQTSTVEDADLILTSVALATATASTMVVGGALTIATSAALICAWQ